MAPNADRHPRWRKPLFRRPSAAAHPFDPGTASAHGVRGSRRRMSSPRLVISPARTVKWRSTGKLVTLWNVTLTPPNPPDGPGAYVTEFKTAICRAVALLNAEALPSAHLCRHGKLVALRNVRSRLLLGTAIEMASNRNSMSARGPGPRRSASPKLQNQPLGLQSPSEHNPDRRHQ